ncbi:hypothetical protein IWW50_004057, partial [Coemansia erecta]
MFSSAGKHHKLATSSAEADAASVADSSATQRGEVLWTAVRENSTSDTAYELAPRDRRSGESASSTFMYRNSAEHAGHVRLRDVDDECSSFGADHSREDTDQLHDRDSETPLHTSGASMV